MFWPSLRVPYGSRWCQKSVEYVLPESCNGPEIWLACNHTLVQERSFCIWSADFNSSPNCVIAMGSSYFFPTALVKIWMFYLSLAIHFIWSVLFYIMTIQQVRRLPVGDGLWIACHKHLQSEYVLDFIVERKKVEDLRSSIRDNRYRDQKLRLQVLIRI